MIKSLFLYGGALLTVVSIGVDLIQPHAESAFAAGQPAKPRIERLVKISALLGAFIAFCGAIILNSIEEKQREREMRHLEELISQRPTKHDLDRIKQDIEHIKQITLEKRNEALWPPQPPHPQASVAPTAATSSARKPHRHHPHPRTRKRRH